MAKKEENINYDTAFAELQDIVNKVQQDDIAIESLSVYIKRASELKLFCEQRLREIEADINKASK